MASEERTAHALDFSQAGLCVQSETDGPVIFQNELSKTLCGDQTGKSCSLCSGIETESFKHSPLHSLVKGLDILRGKIQINDTLCDLYRFKEGDKSLTILNPTQALVDVFLDHFKTLGFTKRELEVSEHLLNGENNGEIIKKLFISRSTLKTHLHNIYEKCPELKEIRNG